MWVSYLVYFRRMISMMSTAFLMQDLFSQSVIYLLILWGICCHISILDSEEGSFDCNYDITP